MKKVIQTMSFIRLKQVKNYFYQYEVQNTWTKKGSRQKVLKYLGKAQIGGLTLKQAQLIFQKYNSTCCNCFTPANTIDHIIPLSKGGNNDEENLQCLCLKCNQKKSNLLRHPDFDYNLRYLWITPFLEIFEPLKKNDCW